MNDADRELLKAAAKAAGIFDDLVEWDGKLIWRTNNAYAIKVWNPLADDGDALRLAVTLGLEIYHSINNDRWSVFVGYPTNRRIAYVFDEWGDDEMAATRRAIVRAAASMSPDLAAGGREGVR